MANLQCPENANMSLTQHSSTNLKNEIHISTHYYVLLRISTHYDYREASQQASYRPPSPPASVRVVVARKRKSVEPATGLATGPAPGPVVEAHAIPVSGDTGRILLWKLDINKRFGKTYIARNQVKQPPLPEMTLSSLWHAVSEHTY